MLLRQWWDRRNNERRIARELVGKYVHFPEQNTAWLVLRAHGRYVELDGLNLDRFPVHILTVIDTSKYNEIRDQAALRRLSIPD